MGSGDGVPRLAPELNVPDPSLAPLAHLHLPAHRPAPAFAADAPRLELSHGGDPLALIAAQAGQVEALLILTEGTERPPPAVMAVTLGSPLPGVGERLRSLLLGRVGPAAAFVQIGAGIVKGSVVVVIPDADGLVEDLWFDLIHPRLLELERLGIGAPEDPAAGSSAADSSAADSSAADDSGANDPEADEPDETLAARTRPEVEAPTQRAFSVDLRSQDTAPPAEDATELTVEPAWQRALNDLGIVLQGRANLPEALDRLAPVRNLLEQPGELRRGVESDGTVWIVAGFPALKGPAAKVLLLSDSALPEDLVVRALHRHPRVVGVGGEIATPGLPARSDPASTLSEELVGRVDPEGGSFFGRDGGAIYLLREGRVFRWDGRRTAPMGSPAQALATLCLDWTQR
jgi:hypothetical protein